MFGWVLRLILSVSIWVCRRNFKYARWVNNLLPGRVGGKVNCAVGVLWTWRRGMGTAAKKSVPAGCPKSIVW
jgi:hypothetical protein